jgi:hypothetical protein
MMCQGFVAEGFTSLLTFAVMVATDFGCGAGGGACGSNFGVCLGGSTFFSTSMGLGVVFWTVVEDFAATDLAFEALGFDLLPKVDLGFDSVADLVCGTVGFSIDFTSGSVPPKILDKNPFFSPSPRAG